MKFEICMKNILIIMNTLMTRWSNNKNRLKSYSNKINLSNSKILLTTIHSNQDLSIMKLIKNKAIIHTRMHLLFKCKDQMWAKMIRLKIDLLNKSKWYKNLKKKKLKIYKDKNLNKIKFKLTKVI